MKWHQALVVWLSVVCMSAFLLAANAVTVKLKNHCEELKQIAGQNVIAASMIFYEPENDIRQLSVIIGKYWYHFFILRRQDLQIMSNEVHREPIPTPFLQVATKRKTEIADIAGPTSFQDTHVVLYKDGSVYEWKGNQTSKPGRFM